MSSSIAKNEYAQQYDALQKSTDFVAGTDKDQLACMMKMEKLLCECKGSTPIFDWHCYNMETGERVVTPASEQLAIVRRRIRRFEQQLN